MIAFHGETDIGRRRSLNEDTIYARDDLFVVCDGMGGHKAGEVASKIAADTMATFIERSGEDQEITWPYGFDRQTSLDGNRLRTAIKLANRAVFRKSASSDDYAGMGTTVAAVLISRSRWMAYAGVGDSRVYLIRGGAIVQLTRDDTWLNAAAEGEVLDDSTVASMKNVLTKALGARDDVDFEVAIRELSAGDVVLLCSDGLTNMVDDDEILRIVTTHGSDPERAAPALIDAANANGGRDNVSAVLLRYT